MHGRRSKTSSSATIDLNRFNAEDLGELYNRFGYNWMEKTEEIPELYLAPLREQYARTVHVIPEHANQDQQQAVFDLAKFENQTVMWSYDDAGATPCEINTAFLWFTKDKDINIFNEWFAKYYPETVVIHPADDSLGMFAPAAAAASSISSFSPWWRRLIARLRRALVPL